MTKLILTFLILTCAWAANWEDPVRIFQYDGRAYYKKTLLDETTGNFYVLYAEFIDSGYRLRLKKIKSNGEMKDAVSLMEQYTCDLSEHDVDMVGSGKDFYVVSMTQIRGYYYEVRFIESHDGGKTWSQPVVPRKTGEDPDVGHTSPQIIVHPSGKLDILYLKRNHGIQRVTREAGSKEWSDEIPFPSTLCKFEEEPRNLLAVKISKEKKEDTILLGFVCLETYDVVMAESVDSINWKEYAFQPVRIKDVFNDPKFQIVYHKETKRVFLSVGQTVENRAINWVFEYKAGGNFLKIYSEPYIYINEVAIGTYIQSGILNLVALFQRHHYSDKDRTAKCFTLNPDQPWKQEQFPLPFLGPATRQIGFYFYGSYLYAFGKAHDNAISYSRIKI